MPPKRFERMSQQGRMLKRYKSEAFPTVALKKKIPFGTRDPGFVDLALASHAADTTGDIDLVATIPQGSSVNERIGKKVQYKSFQVRGHCINNADATSNDISWMLVYDRRPTGSLPSITDVLVSANQSSFLNDANSGRFKILARKDYALVGNSSNVLNLQENSNMVINEYVKCKLPVSFKAAGTGAIADYEMGAVYLITVGNTAAGTGAAAVVVGVRTRFVDV